MGCCNNIISPYPSEAFIIDFLYSFKISQFSFNQLFDIIISFDKRIVLNRKISTNDLIKDSKFKTEGIKAKQHLSPLKRVLNNRITFKNNFKLDPYTKPIANLHNNNIMEFDSDEDDSLCAKENTRRVINSTPKINLVSSIDSFSCLGENMDNIENVNDLENKLDNKSNRGKLTRTNRDYNLSSSRNSISNKETKNLSKKLSSNIMNTDNFLSSSNINMINSINFKSEYGKFLSTNIFDSYAYENQHHKLIITMLQELNIDDYKLNLLAWSFGILQYNYSKNKVIDRDELLLICLDLIYKKNANCSSIKEFINMYIHYNFIILNDVCYSIAYQNKNKLVNGHLITVELLEDLRNLKIKVFNGIRLKKLYNRILSCIDFPVEYKIEESVERHITFGRKELKSNINLDIQINNIDYEFQSDYLKRVRINNKSSLIEYLSTIEVRKLLIEEYERDLRLKKK